ncbi:MAG: PIN domain-containing protein [Candidatus Diapherotrites archaeon]|nr:PIN domain-containing protein [Candidatus Diapherotrites archaeon]
MTEFVFDTYAIIEIIKGNPNYKRYLESIPIINTFVLAELCYALISDHGKQVAFYYTSQYEKFVAQANGSMIKEAAFFRYRNKKRNFSFTDCISYVQSRKLQVKFLTGDKQFENLPNVEFVK